MKIIKVRENRRGQSRMDNPEKLATRYKTKTKQNKKHNTSR
jgi:hypothetical protein